MEGKPGNRREKVPRERNRVNKRWEAMCSEHLRGAASWGWAGTERDGVGSGHLGQPGPGQSCKLRILLWDSLPGRTSWRSRVGKEATAAIWAIPVLPSHPPG